MISTVEKLPASEDKYASPHRRKTWLEVSRVLMTLVVVSEHMPYGTAFDANDSIFLWSPIFFFFVVSGFLTGRNCSAFNYAEAAKRSFRFFTAFVFWQLPVFLAFLYSGRAFNCVVLKEAAPSTLAYYFFLMPVNTPLWFLRDLIILTLISPLLMRLRSGLIFLALAVTSAEPLLGAHSFIPPAILGFYLIGLSFSPVSWELLIKLVKNAGRYCIPVMILLTIGIIVLHIKRWANSPFLGIFYGQSYGILPAVIGVLSALYLGIIIDEKWPLLSSRLGAFGKSSFLVYVAHYPLLGIILGLFNSAPGKSIPGLGPMGYLLTFLATLAIYGGLHELFLVLRRYFPWTFPLILARDNPTPADKVANRI